MPLPNVSPPCTPGSLPQPGWLRRAGQGALALAVGLAATAAAQAQGVLAYSFVPVE